MTTNAWTLQQWITEFRSQLNTIDDFVSRFAISNGERVIFFMDESYLSKYQAELDPYKVTVDLTDREQHYYAYNPRLFAYDIYGYPELWYLVMYANELHSALEFNLKRVRFYQSGVTNVLNAIRILEEPRKDANDQEMSDIVTNNESSNESVLDSAIL